MIDHPIACTLQPAEFEKSRRRLARFDRRLAGDRGPLAVSAPILVRRAGPPPAGVFRRLARTTARTLNWDGPPHVRGATDLCRPDREARCGAAVRRRL